MIFSNNQLSRSTPTRILLGLAAFVLALAALPGDARAASPEVGIQDERVLHSGGPAAQATVDAWKRLGIDVARLHARWEVHAPAVNSRRAPRGFTGADHRDRRYDWAHLDHSINLLSAAGIDVMLTVTGPGPVWSSTDPSRRDGRFKPNAKAFGRFARAVAARYGSKVDRYLIWNEPNQPSWLRPQAERRGGRWELTSPHLYRGLLAAAAPQIRRADRGARIIIGELAPLGWDSMGGGAPSKPLPFLRALSCVDGSYRKIKTGYCRGFKAPAGDALGYHPHPKRLAPDQPNPDRDEANLADLPRLFGVIDRLTRMKRLRGPGGRFPVEFTEFGYQTSPPDKSLGVPLDRHARYLQQAAYITWAARRVRSLVHYQWQDEPVVRRKNLRYGGWQSGLHLITGEAKPALRVFPQPFVIDVIGRGRGRLWGQARGAGRTTVTILRRTRGQKAFAALRDVRTDARGYWSATLPLTRSAEYGFAVRPASLLGAPGARPDRPTSGIVRITRPTARGVVAADAPR